MAHESQITLSMMANGSQTIFSIRNQENVNHLIENKRTGTLLKVEFLFVNSELEIHTYDFVVDVA